MEKQVAALQTLDIKFSPFPKLMIAKTWYDYASLCCHHQSDHPYRVPCVPPKVEDERFQSQPRGLPLII